MRCTCENCGRNQLEMETVTIDQYVAELCVTCAYVLKQNPTKIKQLIRSQTVHEANTEMKKQHQLLSNLIVVGTVGLMVIVGIGIADQLQVFASAEYLSFIELKKL